MRQTTFFVTAVLSLLTACTDDVSEWGELSSPSSISDSTETAATGISVKDGTCTSPRLTTISISVFAWPTVRMTRGRHGRTQLDSPQCSPMRTASPMT